MYGGYGDIGFEEKCTIIWENSTKSKSDLGYKETIIKLNEILQHCYPSNKIVVMKEINQAKRNEGPTIFDKIIEIIQEHQHITLILE
ncbi:MULTISPECIES: hypothetical protein [Bacillaceae]|uniref:Barstar (barnase inhibitor) domain-containing protein n=1 Tax=Domibacillus aminovorans TaxID=29332 RepID=A0A177KID0_9BACI|nr:MULTISPECIES: hypothetical protein [Bacillaceae]OAH53153.1 hypothetical protein AWH48_12415 [Domibacillus aminovorans]